MRATLLLAAGVAIAWTALAPDVSVDLTAAAWQRNGVQAQVPVADGVAALPMNTLGTRWATVFETASSSRARLTLHWVGAPDGLLFEIVLDGARMPPPRDGWRASERQLVSDLGSFWLGAGDHLLEFVAREETTGHVRVARLVVERLPRDG